MKKERRERERDKNRTRGRRGSGLIVGERRKTHGLDQSEIRIASHVGNYREPLH